MSILIINNHDSFVYNLFYYVRSMGESVSVVDNDGWADVSKYEKIIVSPGPGTPLSERDSGNIRKMLDGYDGLILGVCFGHQILAHMLGSRIFTLSRPYHGEVDKIRHDQSPIYEGVPETFQAIRYHSLAVIPSSRIVVDAVSMSDGTVMGFHTPDMHVFGVQFHPESYFTEYGFMIIHNFVRL
ncbi:aminodeoxychorismate/anthranilate synthase component II [Thermoplasma sp.]|uniref:anthranilate synthase component II n=1 Tax=Thermoplasma sp. TaxID=1973142 RepID=UPI0012830070|nr:aminodeoxychorismate/anthranilate synthase component II [Thermoplasma sp.]KAA8921975.1 MAG: aminodeoxychorismate/anthranilate synthase component II [Thermoplasma sp.]